MTAIPEAAVETTQPFDVAALLARLEETGRPYQPRVGLLVMGSAERPMAGRCRGPPRSDGGGR